MTALIIVFAVFSLAVWGLLRYTNKSVGDESPLHQCVTYQITAWQHFTRFNFLFLLSFGAMLVWFMYIIVVHAIPVATSISQYVLFGALISVAGWGLYTVNTVFRLHEQYWTITRDVTVTLNPTDKSLTIQSPEQTVTFTAANLITIERVGAGPNSSKIVICYEYWRFRLISGRIIYLCQNSAYLDYVLESYFAVVPTTYIGRRIPWVE